MHQLRIKFRVSKKRPILETVGKDEFGISYGLDNPSKNLTEESKFTSIRWGGGYRPVDRWVSNRVRLIGRRAIRNKLGCNAFLRVIGLHLLR